jgi:DNA-binding response OmpR family regulator
MKNILIVEDSKQYRSLLKAALTAANYSVVMAEEGKEALNIIQKPDVKIDLILLDLLVPGVDGISFYHTLVNKFEKNIPIIVLTNVADANAYGPNIKNVLIKANVSIEEVLDEVKKYA